MRTFLESLVSDATRRSYKNGLLKFEKWYKKPIASLLKEKDPGKTIERYFVDLKRKLRHNSARMYTNSVIQYCKYNNIDPKIKKSLGVFHTVATTRDHILLVDQAREMYKVGSLEDKVMIKVWLLGLRIGDVTKLTKDQFTFEKLSNEPLEILVSTHKEEITAHIFVDLELQDLLKKYIPLLKNEFLFEGITTKQLLRRLQTLQKKVGFKLTGKVFGWHIARKLFLRTGTELGVNQWSLKMMTGKALDPSIATYIRGVSLVEDARKISNALRMTEPRPNGRIGNLEETVQIMSQAFAKFIRQILKEQGYGTGTIGFTMDYDAMDDEEVIKWYLGER